MAKTLQFLVQLIDGKLDPCLIIKIGPIELLKGELAEGIFHQFFAYPRVIFSTVVFCHFWFQYGTLRPYRTHPHMKGATPDAASNRGSRSSGDCPCGRLPGPLRESVPVSTFPELFDRPDCPGQQKPAQHHPLCAG